jgi:acyl-CoA dehydrogenase
MEGEVFVHIRMPSPRGRSSIIWRGCTSTEQASVGKYWASDVQNSVVDLCLQVFGGYGYMNEYPIARMFRDARVQKIYGGTNEIMKELISRGL